MAKAHNHPCFDNTFSVSAYPTALGNGDLLVQVVFLANPTKTRAALGKGRNLPSLFGKNRGYPKQVLQNPQNNKIKQTQLTIASKSHSTNTFVQQQKRAIQKLHLKALQYNNKQQQFAALAPCLDHTLDKQKHSAYRKLSA